MNGEQDKMVLKSKKHVFWEALLVTIVIFLAGLFLGMIIEESNSSKISNLYIQSEISLTDAMASLSIMQEGSVNCETAKQANIKLADKVYEEALLLEQYEASGKLTNSMKLLHKKYDLLRTLLWESSSKSLDSCQNYDLVIYLYDYETENLEIKAEQNVWSKILLNIKNERQNMLLIPIALNEDITSTNLLVQKYNITQTPAIIINNQQIIYELDTADPVLNALN